MKFQELLKRWKTKIIALGARISAKIQPDTEYSTSMICCDYNAVAGKTLDENSLDFNDGIEP